MIRLFEALAARHPAVETVTVVLDNARYDRSRELKAWLDQPGCRLRLVYLPAYAPNLNLIERFWHVMKRKVLFSRAYAKFALFKQAFDDFFERLHEHEAALATLITDRFHLIGQPKPGFHPHRGIPVLSDPDRWSGSERSGGRPPSRGRVSGRVSMRRAHRDPVSHEGRAVLRRRIGHERGSRRSAFRNTSTSSRVL